MSNSKAKRGIDRIVNLVVAIGLIGIVFFTCAGLFGGCMPDYSDGQRVGELFKFSRKGVIWKSYEGELILNEFSMRRNNSSDSSNIFAFSVSDKSVADQLDALVGQRVRLHYHQYLIGPIWLGTGYSVTKVEAMPVKGQEK